MTLKESLRKIGKIGLVSLISLYSLEGCERNKDKEPYIVMGVYNGYQARSIKEKGVFTIALWDSTKDAGVVGYYFSEDNSFSEITMNEGVYDRLSMTNPIIKYANPDSLLAVNKALRKKK